MNKPQIGGASQELIEKLLARIEELEAWAIARDNEQGRQLVKRNERITHLEAQIKELEGNIKVSGGLKCPSCDDTGIIAVGDNSFGWEQQQCEFCYTVPDSIFNRSK